MVSRGYRQGRKDSGAVGMTVAELIAYLQLQPPDAVVVQPRQTDAPSAFIVFELCSEPRTVQMRTADKLAGFPLPILSYEIDSCGELSGVILE